MRLAIEEAELARGATGDNPWVGCAIVSPHGELIGRGHTLGPGEDHAEIAAARDAQDRGHSVVGATLYSTLEPCSFHGRTPACAISIVERGIARVVLGMRDPHPRVNGAGTLILRNAGVEVIEGVCEAEVRRQLGLWVLEQHPHEPLRRVQALPEPKHVSELAELYGVDGWRIKAFLAKHRLSDETFTSPIDGISFTAGVRLRPASGHTSTPEGDMDHAATIRRFYDLINAGDIDGFGRQLADDFAEREDLPGFPPTRAGVIQYFRMLVAAFPDLRMVPEDVIASGDKAVARVRVTGTHKGPFMGMAGTGKRVDVKLIDIIRFGDDGRAREHWGLVDQLAMLQQLGATPGGPAT